MIGFIKSDCSLEVSAGFLVITVKTVEITCIFAKERMNKREDVVRLIPITEHDSGLYLSVESTSVAN